jgi:hypothetical protein
MTVKTCVLPFPLLSTFAVSHKVRLRFQALALGLLFLCYRADSRELPPFPADTKLRIVGSWSDLTVAFLLPGSTNGPVKSEHRAVSAKRAIYELVPKPPSPYRDQFPVLVLDDRLNNKACVIAADHTFYTRDDNGLTGYTFFTPGIYWSHSYVEVAGGQDGVSRAIAKFEKEVDGQKLNQVLLEERKTSIGLQKASPLFYFLEKPIGGSKRVQLTLEDYDINDGILRLQVRNPATQEPAIYWVSPQKHKVIRSVVNGQEMNVDTMGQPWADPLR